MTADGIREVLELCQLTLATASEEILPCLPSTIQNVSTIEGLRTEYDQRGVGVEVVTVHVLA